MLCIMVLCVAFIAVIRQMSAFTIELPWKIPNVASRKVYQWITCTSLLSCLVMKALHNTGSVMVNSVISANSLARFLNTQDYNISSTPSDYLLRTTTTTSHPKLTGTHVQG